MFSRVTDVVRGFCAFVVIVLAAISLALGGSMEESVFEASVLVVQSKEPKDVFGQIDMIRAGWLNEDFIVVRVERVISGPEISGIVVLNVEMDDDSRKGLRRLEQGVVAFDPSYWNPGIRLKVMRGFVDDLGSFQAYFTRYPCPYTSIEESDGDEMFSCERLDLKKMLWPYCYCVSVNTKLSEIRVLGDGSELPIESGKGE